ncbi:acyltransferase family protein [Naasia sp. SYSU D00948]|uniref:acyltransferase family protein n=1 Tax=Naasia sp. SYSU D00948 TaxID=2817379 RepID=UPI001B30B862|nr:acyltransferase family protein [Naasia sp. SYSU D00948]
MTRTLSVPRRAPSGKQAAGFRYEIQALRAVAVVLVVVYHLWPAYLRGGYVGVDVFFVISGYLISSHVIKSIELGRFGLLDFYARRIRRLLPASLVVLLVTGLATLVWAPQLHWIETGKHLIASALYVENWALLFNAVDYLGASSDVIPSQHFWSLSVEEQFYLVWPLLLIGVFAVARARRWAPRDTALALVGGIVAASLAYSIVMTAIDQPSAYFHTGTRVWEFGTGTLLALLLPRLALASWIQRAVTWLGLAAILLASIFYADDSPFPGYIALLPVAGTALVIAGQGAGGRGSVAPLLRLRPVQFLGDISYSIYLWHWPLIVLLPVALDVRATLPLKLLILVATLVLAYLSKRFIEDPFRVDRPGTADKPRRPTSRRRVFALTAAGMAVVSLLGGGLWAVSSARASAAQEALDSLPDPLTIPCFGAAALADGANCPEVAPDGTIYPDPIVAPADTGDHGSPPCQQGSSTAVIVCSYGSDDASAPRYALAGDSHAAQWMVAMAELAESEGWHLDTYLRSGCGLSTVAAEGLGSAARCAEWNANALERIVEGRYDVVVVSTRSSLLGGGEKPAEQIERNAAEMQASWSAIEASGARVVVLRDTPQPVNAGIRDMPGCVVAEGLEECSFPVEDGLVTDPQVVAAREAGVPVVDLSDYFCREICSPVVGGVLVYRDGSHVSALYIKTLTPFLGEALREELAAP